MNKMENLFIYLTFFSHEVFIGFWVLFIGVIFTSMIFYFVFLRLGEDKHSYKDIHRKIKNNEIQKVRIARFYQKNHYI